MELGPAIHAMQPATHAGGMVYIVTNRPNGTLYIGVTNNLARRAWEHRNKSIEGFTKRYGLGRLVCTKATRTFATRFSASTA